MAEDHLRQMYVVDVIAFALEETRIFFALHRVAHATDFGTTLLNIVGYAPCAIFRRRTERL